MKNNWHKRADKLIDQIAVHEDMLFTCKVDGHTSLEKSIQLKLDDLNKKLSGILKPKIGGVSVGGITDEDIEAARCSDITALFPDHKGYMVICPWHSEKRASASIKKGYLVCFSCGEKADTIKCYMKLHNVTFIEAVKALR